MPTLTQCNQCDYTAKGIARMKAHFVAKHSGEKPYKCKLCDFSFTEPGNLRNHLRIHSGEKPQGCTLCSFVCITKSHLKYHMKSVHLKEKPFKCDQCLYKCATKNMLNIHRASHTESRPYSCGNCDKSYKFKSHLKRHICNSKGIRMKSPSWNILRSAILKVCMIKNILPPNPRMNWQILFENGRTFYASILLCVINTFESFDAL